MARRIHLEPHLSTAELERRYRQAKDGLLRGWWQILWLLARGQTAKAIAESTGYSRSWIGQLARALQRTGPGRHARPIAGSPVSGTPTRGAHRLAARPAGALGRAGGGVGRGARLERAAGRALERAGGRRVDEPAAWPPGALSARLGLPHPPGRASARPPPPAGPRRPRRAGSVQKKLRPLLRQVKAAFPPGQRRGVGDGLTGRPSGGAQTDREEGLGLRRPPPHRPGAASLRVALRRRLCPSRIGPLPLAYRHDGEHRAPECGPPRLRPPSGGRAAQADRARLGPGGMAHQPEAAVARARPSTPLASPSTRLTRTPTGRASLAAHRYGAHQPPFRHHRRPGGRASRAVRRPAGPTRSGPLSHLVPVVATAHQETTRTQEELVSPSSVMLRAI